jgi:YesN/AraC family two-component response regulator
MEELHRDKYYSFRQEILRSFLFEAAQKSTAVRHFKEFNIGLDPDRSFILVIIKIDRFQAFCEANDANARNLQLFSIGNIAQEIISSGFSCEYTQTDGSHLILIINTPDEQILFKLKNSLMLIQSAVSQYLGLSVSCIISKTVEDYKYLYEEYARTLEMSSYRLVHGHSCILSISELETAAKPDSFKYPARKEKQLLDQLLLGKPELAVEIYNEMVAYAKTFSYNDLMVFFSNLSLSVNACISKLADTVQADINFNFYEFSKTLNNMETIDEINEKFEALFREISNSLSPEAGEKNDTLVSSIQEFINCKYVDPNLSLYTVAEYVNKSPVYLGRIYKKATGKSIQDEINDVRLKKSMELLSRTQLTVQEICSQVGVANEKYFFIFFKKHIGITPNEYRNKTLGNRSKIL